MRSRPAQLPCALRVLVGTSFMIALGYGLITPALPLFAAGFDVGVTAAAALVSAFALVRIGFAPASGRLVGRWGERPVFCGGLAVVAASSAACAFAGSYWQLLVLRSVGGIGSTMFTVSSAALLVRLSPAHLRGRATGSWAAAFLLGTVAGPLAGAALIVDLDVRSPFLAYAALLTLTAAVGGLVLRRAVADVAGPRRVAGTVTFPAAFRNRTFRAALSTNFVHGWLVHGVWVALVPLYVVDVLARPTGWSGAVLAVCAAGTAVALVVGGRLADARGRKLLVLVGLAVAAAGTLLPSLHTSLTAFLVAALLAGAGAGLVEAPTNAAVAAGVGAGGARGGTALAGFQMVGDVGAVIGPVVAGLVADAAGYDTAFALTALVAAGAFGQWVGAPETAPRGLRAPT